MQKSTKKKKKKEDALTRSGEHDAASCCTGRGRQFCTLFWWADGWWSCLCHWTHSSLHLCNKKLLPLNLSEQKHVFRAKDIANINEHACGICVKWAHVAIKNTLTEGWCPWPVAQISVPQGWPYLRPWKWKTPWGQTDRSNSYPPNLSAADWPGGTVWTSWAVWTASDGRWCR